MTQPSTTAARPAVGRIQNDQEHADLLTYHLTVLRQAEAEVETAKGPVTEAKAKLSGKQEELTKRFNAAKADLGRGYTREYLAGLLKDGRTKTRVLVDLEVQRARDKIALSQPVFGQQPELFPGEETPTLAKDEMAWTAEGLMRGMRGDIDEIQDGDPPEFQQAIMAGFRAGQQLAGERYQRAQQIIAARETPNADAAPKDLNAGADAEPEPGTPAAKKKERASVAAAKASLDKMGKGAAVEGAEPDGDGFEASPEELAKQTTRAAVVGAKAGATTGEPVH